SHRPADHPRRSHRGTRPRSRLDGAGRLAGRGRARLPRPALGQRASRSERHEPPSLRPSRGGSGMTWLTWRQHRQQALAGAIGLGTHRLVWTQSVTRRRWFTTKIALVLGVSVAGAAAFAALVTWWSALFVQAGDDRLQPGIFDIRGIVPIAYVLFALALGVLAGTLIRKTLPAMAATLAGYVGVRAIVALVARRFYLPAKTLTSGMFGPNPRMLHGDWVLSTNTLDRAGKVIAPGQ